MAAQAHPGEDGDSIATTATAIAILHLRTAHVVYYTGAILATSFTAKGLKRLIKQPRPVGSRVKKTSGMPSTHSASVSFMGSYLVLVLALAPSSSSSSTPTSGMGAATMVGLGALCIGLPVAVMWSRVRLGVHTPAQTVAGAALGVVKALFWFTLWYGSDQVWRRGASAVDARDASGGVGRLWTQGLATHVGLPVDAFVGRCEARLLGTPGGRYR
ncbi:uncharacterized protein PFL1_03496 [Pseudozyma flocculosa PF-1]|uniref:Phosphatidic acid phosphatase type 2/haloperoxidase domain-containing protein n=1 Tax=Pseudozyma flocculosa PF-1 TaxID=1277687 RepID=A0A061H9S6_9BASI|nr:uncharacterized protein PFL1_03496 [Pseudozyma flocculosa PF-1]EPQ29209.1 hypothetical protein PFL1_03496 [Pseudozyma flocculosa PF-1]